MIEIYINSGGSKGKFDYKARLIGNISPNLFRNFQDILTHWKNGYEFFFWHDDPKHSIYDFVEECRINNIQVSFKYLNLGNNVKLIFEKVIDKRWFNFVISRCKACYRDNVLNNKLKELECLYYQK